MVIWRCEHKTAYSWMCRQLKKSSPCCSKRTCMVGTERWLDCSRSSRALDACAVKSRSSQSHASQHHPFPTPTIKHAHAPTSRQQQLLFGAMKAAACMCTEHGWTAGSIIKHLRWRGGHGVALVHGLQRAARHLPHQRAPGRLVAGRHQLQPVPQAQRPRLHRPWIHHHTLSGPTLAFITHILEGLPKRSQLLVVPAPSVPHASYRSTRHTICTRDVQLECA